MHLHHLHTMAKTSVSVNGFVSSTDSCAIKDKFQTFLCSHLPCLDGMMRVAASTCQSRDKIKIKPLALLRATLYGAACLVSAALPCRIAARPSAASAEDLPIAPCSVNITGTKDRDHMGIGSRLDALVIWEGGSREESNNCLILHLSCWNAPSSIFFFFKKGEKRSVAKLNPSDASHHTS